MSDDSPVCPVCGASTQGPADQGVIYCLACGCEAPAAKWYARTAPPPQPQGQ